MWRKGERGENVFDRENPPYTKHGTGYKNLLPKNTITVSLLCYRQISETANS